jgi:hypothetical protein
MRSGYIRNITRLSEMTGLISRTEDTKQVVNEPVFFTSACSWGAAGEQLGAAGAAEVVLALLEYVAVRLQGSP